MRMRRTLAISTLAVAAVLLAAPAAFAADDYAADPNELINHYDDVSRYSTGTDLWRVWVCDTALDGSVGVVSEAVDILNGEIADVYDWLSEGMYDLQFEAGGTVSVPTEDGDDCIQAVLDASTPSAAAGVFIITDGPGWSGVASPGYTNQSLSPANRRYALVTYNGVFSYSIAVSAHELGHTIYWPHSYVGPSEYDNPIDVMSGGFGAYGTLAINRYAAGWVDPGQVTVIDGTVGAITLGPVGDPGTQLLIVPGDETGDYFALDVRVDHPYDSRAAAHGVTVHEVRHDCASTFFCAGTQREQIPKRPTGDSYGHVLTIGESAIVGKTRLEVVGASGGGYQVAFEPVYPDGFAMQNPNSGYWTLDDGYGFYYGIPADLPMACDWDGDGVSTPGLYRQSSGFLYLRQSNTFGVSDISIYFGIPEDIPICGDWNGDGTETIGIYRPSESTFYLRNSNTFGVADVQFTLGAAGDVPLAGDWDGDGIDTPAVFRADSGELIVRATNDPDWSPATHFLEPAIPAGAVVFAGDWDGDGTDTVGYHEAGTSWFSNVLGGAKDLSHVWGTDHNPVIGVWAIS
ncbi:MAG: hypothetical protein EX267_11535 [Acidimicrobiia bacterium]|nr:MAG: hypothetical protein EX267_11535 [Acidimicrobiia bacterium]